MKVKTKKLIEIEISLECEDLVNLSKDIIVCKNFSISGLNQNYHGEDVDFEIKVLLTKNES
jgi:hypothetical protein